MTAKRCTHCGVHDWRVHEDEADEVVLECRFCGDIEVLDTSQPDKEREEVPAI